MPGPEPAGPLTGRGARKDWRQGFAGQRAPLTQISSLTDPPPGFGATNQRPVGDRMGELAAQLFWRGLLRQLIDQRMFAGGQAPSRPLVALQQCQPFSTAQHLRVEPDDRIDGGVQRIEGRRGGFAVCDDTQTHTDETRPTHRQKTSPRNH
jgi:hypothetical protein